MKAIIFLVILALASARRPVLEAPGLIRPKLVGGEEAGETEFPYQVDIQITWTGGLDYDNYCSGAIYDDLRIITAAQCFSRYSLDSFRILAGVHDIMNLRGNEQNRSIAKIEVHDNYVQDRYEYDIAIVTLNEPLMFNQRVQPIRLAIPTIEASGQGVSTGWGSVSDDGNNFLPKLQKVTMNIIDRETCARDYAGTAVEVTSNMICASAPGKAACIGDVGAPLSVKDEANRPYLGGVVSFGAWPCAMDGFHTVYTNIAGVRGWLESKLNP